MSVKKERKRKEERTNDWQVVCGVVWCGALACVLRGEVLQVPSAKMQVCAPDWLKARWDEEIHYRSGPDWLREWTYAALPTQGSR